MNGSGHIFANSHREQKKNFYPGAHSDQGYPTNSGFFPQERMTKHFSFKVKMRAKYS